MLITLPDFDPTTSYVSAWSEEIIGIAERNGINPTVIKGSGVTKTHIEKAIKSSKSSFLAFNGHGTDSCIGGHDNEPLITLGKNDNLLDSKIVHALTCNSAAKLGKGCNASAFLGYDGIFWLYMDGNKTSRPLEDMKARPILESALEAPKQIAKRKTAGEAFRKSQDKSQMFIDDMTKSSSKHTTEELQVILPFLHANKSCQKLHGNAGARI